MSKPDDLPRVATWSGDDYQRRFDDLAASGVDVHGEADLIESLHPQSVLDAGCGTGRVAIELARRGIEVVGVDAEPSMIAAARRRAPALSWIVADLVGLDLGRRFDIVVLAGNVPLFTRPGTQGPLVAGCSQHVAAGGALVSGFQLGRGYELSAYDEHCTAAGLVLEDRWSTWDRTPWSPGDTYAVSIHRHPAGAETP
jgi:SAM-dependent methyltransferase